MGEPIKDAAGSDHERHPALKLTPAQRRLLAALAHPGAYILPSGNLKPLLWGPGGYFSAVNKSTVAALQQGGLVAMEKVAGGKWSGLVLTEKGHAVLEEPGPAKRR